MILVLVFLLFILPGRAYAQTKIDLTLVGNYFDVENNLEVQIEAVSESSESEALKVRPRLDPPQTMFIYAGGEIFGLGSFWSDLPSIPDKLTLHAPVPFNYADLWFEVQDVQTGKTYETSKKRVFGRRFTRGYIADLNKNLFGW